MELLLELLHELREREVTDMMAEHAGAKVCGWEYDGVLFACPPRKSMPSLRTLQHKIGLPLKHKAYRSLEDPGRVPAASPDPGLAEQR